MSFRFALEHSGVTELKSNFRLTRDNSAFSLCSSIKENLNQSVHTCENLLQTLFYLKESLEVIRVILLFPIVPIHSITSSLQQILAGKSFLEKKVFGFTWRYASPKTEGVPEKPSVG